MKVCLINPHWTFDGSIYFGCREPHLPLELGYSKALLEREGHEAEIIDAHMDDLSHEDVRLRVEAFAPDMTVVTTAPTYLFWRCAPPELRVPREVIDTVRPHAGRLVAVGPHGSTTPRAALGKLEVDEIVMGECEEIVVKLANGEDRAHMPGLAFRHEKMESGIKVNGGPQAATFTDLPALEWPDAWVKRHRHHHHRFDREPNAPGAEVEASRGCPFSCSFCAKENFRDKYRKRDLPTLMAEIDRLIAQGVEYLYFVDEIFLPDKPLLDALVERDVEFGIQTRLDLWKFPMIELLGKAGCVSIEAGVESITPEGRAMLDKNCKLGTDELTERLIHAKKFVPFVQANLIELPTDDPQQIAAWREVVRERGVWANDPVPLFPYPGSPDYRKLFGRLDDQAWERAMDYYLREYVDFSDIQEDTPLPLADLERRAAE
ncbi:TIGR04295 family B12-binding domain-containing radical SAM protein [Caenispirillum salinarum]|uniref:TIGR04295 family B12-binding domain-containing radical SAM protein n=1 Tax=Caenispirillum salinarum TaxID=859058 RepID=UPI0038500D63